MSGIINEMKSSDYKNEIVDGLHRLVETMPVYKELVLAAGKMPYWILGGSRMSSMWAGDMVPRDTDPVSRSALGFCI